MELTRTQLAERYKVSVNTIENYKKIMIAHNGVIVPPGDGKTKHLYETDILDPLAKNGTLGQGIWHGSRKLEKETT